ncbi:type II toxin-antitoxin system RelE/ParE family toxin [Candidatus Thiosymbion oneisti]|uniref:type II toxin-antitoxin system RelE/ParE family toxin n=1 Tax=Candidatus Thiosymbion oneisti TaxID=589554 RepID=UPI000B7E00D3|nr:type II toxin-antitoxin system RelE/ParE family toxin [Candidatus Thiosymbion oneisti]
MALQYTEAFKRQLRRLSRKYRRIRHDITPVFEQLDSGEYPGDQISGTGYTLYKVRAPNRDAQRGTSGGYRIIYYLQTEDDVLLVAIYSKIEQSDISADEIRKIMQEERA